MKNAFLSGRRVHLRALETADAPLIITWFNDPEVRRTLQAYRPMMVETEVEWLERMAHSDRDLALGIVPRGSERLIGVAGLHGIDPRHRHAGFGIAIGETSEWGKGYGTDATQAMVDHAFLTLNLNRVWLHVYEFNARGRRAYERVGFQLEGTLREAYFGEGRYWDVHTMAILRADWERRRAKSEGAPRARRASRAGAGSRAARRAR
ncbi:MAG TPA: GNAT family protein [Candidatus Eisenbacteria bacterium]|nr:GNAT family protein [Candidatus Eisenbacteria bacterium]